MNSWRCCYLVTCNLTFEIFSSNFYSGSQISLLTNQKCCHDQDILFHGQFSKKHATVVLCCSISSRSVKSDKSMHFPSLIKTINVIFKPVTER